MKQKVIIISFLEVLCFAVGAVALLSILINPTNATDCTPSRIYETVSAGACNLIYKSERDYITYPGGAQFTDIVGGQGQCGFGRECWPQFLTPTVSQTAASHGTTSVWEQTVYNYTVDSAGCYFLSYRQIKIPNSGYTCCDSGYAREAL